MLQMFDLGIALPKSPLCEFPPHRIPFSAIFSILLLLYKQFTKISVLFKNLNQYDQTKKQKPLIFAHFRANSNFFNLESRRYTMNGPEIICFKFFSPYSGALSQSKN